MKKVLSLLLVTVLAVGNVGFAATAPKATTTKAPVVAMATKTGVIVSFTEKSVVISENGKMVTYVIDKKTKATSAGQEGMFLDFASKGQDAKFQVKGNVVVTIDIGAKSFQSQGALSPFTAVETRINETDDNVMPADSATVKYSRADLGTIDATDFTVISDGAKIEIGGYDLVEGSLKVKVGDRELVATTKDFDAKVANDEYKITVEKRPPLGQYKVLVLEKALAKEEIEKVTVSYTKKNYKMTAVETSMFTMSEGVVAELNGKKVDLSRLFNRANFALYDTNTKGEVCYINGYYNNLSAKVVSVAKGKITFSVMRNDVVAFTDTLTVDANVMATDKAGAVINYTKIAKDTEITISNDPSVGYNVVLIQTK